MEEKRNYSEEKLSTCTNIQKQKPLRKVTGHPSRLKDHICSVLILTPILLSYTNLVNTLYMLHIFLYFYPT